MHVFVGANKLTSKPANTEDDTMDTSKSVNKDNDEERLPDVKTTIFKTTDRSRPKGAAGVRTRPTVWYRHHIIQHVIL